jgi:anti-sigma B factor antagonist
MDSVRIGTSTRERDGRPILEVQGEIDIFTAPLFKQAVVALVSQGQRHLFIDMSGVEFMDSSGFAALLGATKRLRPHGGTIQLFGCNRTIEGMLRLIRLDAIVGIHASEEEALRTADVSKTGSSDI